MDSNFHGGEIKKNIKLDFSVNTNPLGIPDYVMNALKNSMDNLCEYPDRNCTRLIKCIAELESVNDNQIVCGNGASELIMAITAYINKSNNNACTAHDFPLISFTALLYSPTFSGYERAVRAHGGSSLYYKNIDELLSILNDDIKLNENNIKLLFICNPNNPTGEVIKQSDLLSIIEIARNKNIIVVIDECFIDFTHEQTSVSLIDKYDNLIVLKAFTKFYSLAGLRLGYICANESLTNKISCFLPEWNVSSIAQTAGIASIENIDNVNLRKTETLKLIDSEREYLTKELEKLNIKISDSKSNFLLCRYELNDEFLSSKNVNKDFKAENNLIYNALLKQGILVRDCSNFHGLDNSYFRICISNHANNEVLINTLKQIIH